MVTLTEKYVHAAMKHRFKRNGIISLNIERGKIEKVEELKQEVKKHFEVRLQESNVRRNILKVVDFK